MFSTAVRPAVVAVLILITTSAIGQKLRGKRAQQAPAATSGCKGSFCDGVPDDKFAVLLEKEGVQIAIGSSKANEKCITHSSPVECSADAGNIDKRRNDDESSDKFIITVKNGNEVCARRSDHPSDGWGQFLKIMCKEVTANPNEKCMCLTSAEGDCSCKGCTEAEQVQTCHELLGPCMCQRSEEAICDCSGYCHVRQDRQDACENEAGCQWSGQWCEAQIGLLWD